MLAMKRLQIILEQMRIKKVVLVGELSRELGVSEETIRRDLEKLEKQGALHRVHGGAYLAEGYGNETPVSVREKIYRKEKSSIARGCMALIQEQDSLMLDCSTTAMYIARELVTSRKRVTVITNSLLVADEVSKSDAIRLLMPGGEFDPRTNAFYGDSTIRSIGRYYASKAFISSAGISIRAGVSDYTNNEAAVRIAMIERSGTCIYAADLTKFGRAAVHAIASLAAVGTIVVDQPVERRDKALKKELESLHIPIIVCDGTAN